MDDPVKKEPSIFCPECRWRPGIEDRWMCAPGCGTVWNTFWTHGLCPGCSHRWKETECLACRKISPHKAWYHWPESDSIAAEHALKGTVSTDPA